MIAHYAPRLHGLFENGTTLTGTAYGPHLFGPAHRTAARSSTGF